MREHYIVLTPEPDVARDIFKGPLMKSVTGSPLAENYATGDFSIEVRQLTKQELIALNKDGRTLSAPVLPLKLISPMAEGGDAGDADAWGVKAVGADTSAFSGEGVIVAILDTGIDRSHKAFAGINIVERDFTGEGNGDNNGHGTHCAGIMFGKPVNGVGIGIAPGIKKALIGKVLDGNGTGTTNSIVEALQWAVREGANVISMSLGFDFPGYVRWKVDRGIPVEAATSEAMQAFRATVTLFEGMVSGINAESVAGMKQPVLIVAAAGNESQRYSQNPYEVFVATPASSEGIISVAAIGRDEGEFYVAGFSNTGANASGPGVKIVSAQSGTPDKLIAYSGTSMATPCVAGVAALWAELLIKKNMFSAKYLLARLLSSGVVDGFRNDTDLSDVGCGMVRAPQGSNGVI